MLKTCLTLMSKIILAIWIYKEKQKKFTDDSESVQVSRARGRRVGERVCVCEGRAEVRRGGGGRGRAAGEIFRFSPTFPSRSSFSSPSFFLRPLSSS